MESMRGDNENENEMNARKINNFSFPDKNSVGLELNGYINML